MAVRQARGKASAVDEHLRPARRLRQRGVAMADIQQPDMQPAVGLAPVHGAHQYQRCRQSRNHGEDYRVSSDKVLNP